jgi:signal transduction histidine kinase
MPGKRCSFLFKFVLAIVVVLIASTVRTVLYVFLDEAVPYTPFYPAVVVATMIGGLHCGVLATALACVAATFWLEPLGKLLIEEPTDFIGMSLFLTVNLLIVWLCNRMRKAQERAEKSADERRHLLMREQESRAAAEAANRLKDEFLASVSHELRTPLQSIIGWSEVIRLSVLDPEQATSAVDTIQRNARLQARLIEDLLDVSRIVTGKMRLDVRRSELVSLIETAIESLLPAVNAKNIRIERRFETSNACVDGDPDRLQQVVWNLLANAIKFTPADGRIEVTLRHETGMAVIEVADSGTGIAPEFLPYVFERFRQENGATSRRYGGLGLGLAIVKHLVELHGGTVDAFSAGLGCGATFCVRLPLRSVGAFTATERPDRAIPSKSLDGLRILAVDDEPDTCQLVKCVLEMCGAVVLVASTAEEALSLWKEWNPHLLISDLGMPEQDGYQLIQAIRERSDLPAVAFTALAAKEHCQRALDSGYQLHLTKPIEPAAFASAIAKVAQRRPR